MHEADGIYLIKMEITVLLVEWMNGACKSNRLCQALTDRSKIKNKFKTDFYTSKLAF